MVVSLKFLIITTTLCNSHILYCNACHPTSMKTSATLTTSTSSTTPVSLKAEEPEFELEPEQKTIILERSKQELERIPNQRCGQTVGFDPKFDPTELNPWPSMLGRRRRVNRVVGGDPVFVDNAWPWLVAIYYHGLKFICSGSLIHQDFVLTAASCLLNKSSSHVFVSLGSSRLSDDRTKLLSVESIRIHDGFSKDFMKNDIALIKLKLYVALSPRINTICLPTKSDGKSLLNKNAFVVGWGSTDGKMSTSVTLNQLILTVHGKNKPCRDDEESKYCASRLVVKNANICWYDVGSPLMSYDNKNKNWILYGIASSFGIDGVSYACDTSKPSAYTIVPRYIGWIERHMNIQVPEIYRRLQQNNELNNQPILDN